MEAGVDVNIRNAQNTTPLHVALNRGANSCVGLLLAAGANCNLQVLWLSIFQSFSKDMQVANCDLPLYSFKFCDLIMVSPSNISNPIQKLTVQPNICVNLRLKSSWEGPY